MTASSTPDLVSRVLAAITELENAAREAKWSGEWLSVRNNDMPLVCADVALVNSEGEFLEYVATDVERSTAVHIALHDPATVLRRCAADRKILAAHPYEPSAADYIPSLPAGGPSFFCHTCHFSGQYDVGPARWGVYCDTVLALAEGYGITKDGTQ